MPRRTALLALLFAAALLNGVGVSQAAATVNVYLPLVSSPPVPAVAIQFGSGIAVNGQLSGVATSFPAGTRALYYQLKAPTAAGLAFTERWSRAGVRQPALDFAGTFASSGERTSAVGTADGGALPNGIYRLEVRVAGRLAAAAEATIGIP